LGLGGHIGTAIEPLTGNRILIVDQTLGKVFGFFSFPESKAQDGLATTFLVHDPYGKVPAAVRHGLDIMDHVMAGADQIDLTQGEEAAALAAFLLKGEDNQ
jgi:hypothetical protein